MGVGSDVFAIGYAGMNEEVKFNVRGQIMGDHHFELNVSKGRVMEQYPDNFEKNWYRHPARAFHLQHKFQVG